MAATNFTALLGKTVDPAPLDAAFLGKLDVGGDASATSILPSRHGALLAGANARAASEVMGDWPDVRNFGVKADGITDDTAAINAAIARGIPLKFPDRPMRITDSIKFRATSAGQTYRFLNRGQGGFVPSGDFNMGARGIVDIEVPSVGTGLGAQAGPIFSDFRIAPVQPDTTVRANLLPYPPSIYAVNSPRLQITRPRIEYGMDGIIFDHDCGGQTVTDAELSCFKRNLLADGSADSIRFERPHVWPFGNAINLISIFMEQATIGVQFGRADDFHVTGGLFICGNPVLSQQGALSGVLAGPAFGAFTDCDFDTFGGVHVTAGFAQFANCRFTLGPFTTPGGVRGPAYALLREGNGQVELAGCHFLVTSTTTNGYVICDNGSAEGGWLSMVGGGIDMTSVDAQAITVSGSQSLVALSGFPIRRAPGAAVANTSVVLNSGRGTVTGITFTPPGSGGSGGAIALTANLPYAVAGCSFGGRGVQQGGSAGSFVGNAS